MAHLLLLETATDVCSVAIAADGDIIARRDAPASPSHAALLTLQIDACAGDAGLSLGGLDAVAISAGPGAYTSLRVGASVAKGLCYALDKPLIAVDTLRALAAASAAATAPGDALLFLPMLDARRKEVWLAAFDASLQLLAPAQPLVFENDLFEKFLAGLPAFGPETRLVLSGNGAMKAPSGLLAEQTAPLVVTACSAAFLLEEAEKAYRNSEFQDIAYYEPFYMKPPNITQPGKSLLQKN